MNSNSILCNFIKDNPEDWEAKIGAMRIKITREGSYAMFKYQALANLSSPIVQEARGIVINLDTLDVVCYPFTKFGNYNENYAAEIDWSTARVQEKVDGSLVKVWWDSHLADWRWSSNGSIVPDTNIAPVLKAALQNTVINYSILDKDCTYIFELISPNNQIIVKYNETKLIHLGTRNNKTGKELIVDIGVEKPKEYNLSNQKDCLNFVKTLNISALNPEHEGFVVVDAMFNRIKIKTPEYIEMHKLFSDCAVNKKSIISMIMFKPKELDDIMSAYPKYQAKMLFYIDEYKKLIEQVRDTSDLVDSLVKQYGSDRKSIALTLKGNRYSGFAFKYLDTHMSPEELLVSAGDASPARIEKYLADFKHEYNKEDHA